MLGIAKEALINSTRAGGEGFWLSRKYQTPGIPLDLDDILPTVRRIRDFHPWKNIQPLGTRKKVGQFSPTRIGGKYAQFYRAIPDGSAPQGNLLVHTGILYGNIDFIRFFINVDVVFHRNICYGESSIAQTIAKGIGRCNTTCVIPTVLS